MLDCLKAYVLSPFMSYNINAMITDILSQNLFISNFLISWFVLYNVFVYVIYIFICKSNENKLEKDVRYLILNSYHL